jgi:hypothetical protein
MQRSQGNKSLIIIPFITQASISLDWILNYTNKKDTIIDVGAGVSVLIDNLLDKGYR